MGWCRLPADSVGEEVSQLVRRGPSRGPEKGKPYSHKRAVGAAMAMKRAGKFKRGKKRKRSR